MIGPTPPRAAATPHPSGPARHSTTGAASLSLASLGIVFGDIGTSPLYALKACFAPEHGIGPSTESVLGVLSLIVWALTLVVTVKYVVFVMRADNCGEGGILALLALVRPRPEPSPRAPRRIAILVALGLFGAALLYGDGVITPAISVLSAVEGVEVAAPSLGRIVVPVALALVVALFLIQRQGTGRVGRVFGPVMLVWFLTIAVLGAREVVLAPGVLRALAPVHGLRFLVQHGFRGMLVLGAVVLAVTGAEALYADMGHFGKGPIRLAWFLVVFPALLLNYAGQGALLLRAPGAVGNPFYRLAPPGLLYPLVVLATVATVIASQALISGAFSLTQQAMQLGYAPRLEVRHTSAEVRGRVYVPVVNGALMIGCVLLVVGFRSSERLGAAYGIAVTGTMAITTLLFHAVARRRWGWPRLAAGATALVFFVVDGAFLVANLAKIRSGGWVPLVIGVAVFTLLSTWERGRRELLALRHAATQPIEAFIAGLRARRVVRVPGIALFFTGQSAGAPAVLQRYVGHTRTLPERVVLLSVVTRDRPVVAAEERVAIKPLAQGLERVTAHYGFMETPEIADVVRASRECGTPLDPEETVFVVAREHVLPEGPAPMARWRKRLFAFMHRNAHTTPDFFGLPADRVIELGVQVQL